MNTSQYIFKLNGQLYSPYNIGDIKIATNLVTDNGAYQHVKELSGDLVFRFDAYDFILLHGECQKITFQIIEKCGRIEMPIYDGYFTYSIGEDDKVNKTFTVSPKADTLYQCLIDSIDREFNLLQTPNIVSSDYAAVPELVFDVGGINDKSKPFFGAYLNCGNSASTPLFAISVFAYEKVSTYCQAGEPQPPDGTGWELFYNRCNQGIADWVRRADALDSIPCVAAAWSFQLSPAPPAITADNQNWVLVKSTVLSGIANYLWFDYNRAVEAYGGNVTFGNGRNLDEVIDYGLNQVCPDLDVQSRFLRRDTNPVTGNNPSSTKGIQLHSISDVRSPTASLPATVETTTLSTILKEIIQGKLNCYWTIDEGTKRLIIEHYKDLLTGNPIDLTAIDGGKWIENKNKVTFDNSDIPLSESFDSLEKDIDFKGVPIEYNGNPCANGVKNYSSSNIFTDIQTIFNNPDEFGNDGICLMLPNSLAPIESVNPSGSQSEKGKISGVFKPNAPLAMANLQDKFWKFYRPFKNGYMNFVNTEFEQKQKKENESITYPVCCYSSFSPYSKFITNYTDSGRLVSSEFDLQTRNITINLIY